MDALGFANERLRVLNDRLQAANLEIARLKDLIDQRDGVIDTQEAQIIDLLNDRDVLREQLQEAGIPERTEEEFLRDLE